MQKEGGPIVCLFLLAIGVLLFVVGLVGRRMRVAPEGGNVHSAMVRLYCDPARDLSGVEEERVFHCPRKAEQHVRQIRAPAVLVQRGSHWVVLSGPHLTARGGEGAAITGPAVYYLPRNGPIRERPAVDGFVGVGSAITRHTTEGEARAALAERGGAPAGLVLLRNELLSDGTYYVAPREAPRAGHMRDVTQPASGTGR